MKNTSSAIVTLFRFMRLFKIDRFKIISANEATIKAEIGWPDDRVGNQFE